ncbi:MAG: hypothetical protein SFX73_08835 [Kofleriaceae bacterium]|nr:hypothetical protein [Kofleriaceae bacterium]
MIFFATFGSLATVNSLATLGSFVAGSLAAFGAFAALGGLAGFLLGFAALGSGFAFVGLAGGFGRAVDFFDVELDADSLFFVLDPERLVVDISPLLSPPRPGTLFPARRPASRRSSS